MEAKIFAAGASAEAKGLLMPPGKDDDGKHSNAKSSSAGEPSATDTETPGSAQGAGLVNSGADCAMNSIIQALFHCNPWKNAILTAQYAFDVVCVV
jgi:uncharacterized UBP type Zn finger protein